MQLILSDFIGWIILLSRVPRSLLRILAKRNSSEDISLHSSGIAVLRAEVTMTGAVGRHSSISIREVPFDMKPATIIGVLLILLAIIGFASGGFSFTHEHKDVDAGPIQISHEKKETVPISPILSTISLLAGIGLVAVGAKSR